MKIKKVAVGLAIVMAFVAGQFWSVELGEARAANTIVYPHSPGAYDSALDGGSTYDGSDDSQILTQVKRQSFAWGTVMIYAEQSTRIGYMVIFDKDGYPISTHEMKNVLGEPQRYDTDGSVMARLEPESWQFIEYCNVAHHPQGAPGHYHLNKYYSSVYTGN